MQAGKGTWARTRTRQARHEGQKRVTLTRAWNLTITSMLPFVPRKVAKKLPPKTPSGNLQKDPQSVGPSSSAAPPAATLPSAPEQHVIANQKGKEKASPPMLAGEECAALFALSLSDYALWSSPDLRRVIETSNDGCMFVHFLIRSLVMLTICSQTYLYRTSTPNHYTSLLSQFRLQKLL